MIITSEQVSNGHPDKICDQISDAVLTVCLEQDKNSRVAVETLIKDNHIVVAGEMKTTALFDLKTVVRNVVKPLGMKNIIVTNLIGLQSDDISQGVDTGGAGDQGMMYGYATDETDEYLPLPYVLATRVLENLMELQHPLLGKDAKAQVSYDYDNKRITTFLVSIQHSDEMTIENLRVIVKESMMKVAKRYRQNLDFNILVNPTGRFVLGGSYADAGVTGRKIIADTYGGFAHHGGGAFSGKDPSKVDRSGAYMARKIAKDIRCKSEGEDFYMYREVQKRPVIKGGRRQFIEVETVGALTQWGATVPTMNLSELFHKNFYIMQFDEKGNPDWSEPHRKESES